MVVGGSGSDDILDILIRVVSPKKIVVCSPTFGMYSFLAKLQVFFCGGERERGEERGEKRKGKGEKRKEKKRKEKK